MAIGETLPRGMGEMFGKMLKFSGSSSLYIIVGVFIFAISTNFSVEAANNECSQENIQKIVSKHSIFEENGQAMVSKCGKLGKVIIDYATYANDRKSNSNLSNVYNYNLFEIMEGRDIKNNYVKLISINSSNEFYTVENMYFNIAKYKYMIYTARNFQDIYQEMEYISILRYLVPYFKGKLLKEYFQLLLKVKTFIFEREQKFWEKYFNHNICNSEDYQSECMKKIAKLIYKQKNDSEQVVIRSVCHLGLMHEGKLFKFILCDRI